MKKMILIGVVLVILVILVSGAMFTVKENQYACTVRFSKIIDTTDEAGLHFKLPFIDSVKYSPRPLCSTTFRPLRSSPPTSRI